MSAEVTAMPAPATPAVRRTAIPHHYLPGLDGLRALAIALVLFAHTGHAFAYTFGQAGVEVFFVLSGFLITWILLAEYASRGRVSFGRFYLRRFLRLYPALLLAVLVFWPLRQDIFVAAYQSLAHWAKVSLVSLFYVANLPTFFFRDGNRWMSSFTSFWTLSVEEQFYVFWPAVLVGLIVLGRRRLTVVLAGLAVLIVASLALTWYVTNPARGASTTLDWQLSLPFRAWMLLAGCALAVLVSTGALDRLVGHRAWSLVGSLGLALLIWSCVRYQVPAKPDGAFLLGFYRHRTVLVTVASLLMIAAVVFGERRVFARSLALAPIRGLGRISYGVYVYHTMIFTILGNELRAHYLAWWVGVLQVVASLIFATVAFLLWERPFLRLKGSRRLRARTAAVEPAPRTLPGVRPPRRPAPGVRPPQRPSQGGEQAPDGTSGGRTEGRAR